MAYWRLAYQLNITYIHINLIFADISQYSYCVCIVTISCVCMLKIVWLSKKKITNLFLLNVGEDTKVAVCSESVSRGSTKALNRTNLVYTHINIQLKTILLLSGVFSILCKKIIQYIVWNLSNLTALEICTHLKEQDRQ